MTSRVLQQSQHDLKQEIDEGPCMSTIKIVCQQIDVNKQMHVNNQNVCQQMQWMSTNECLSTITMHVNNQKVCQQL